MKHLFSLLLTASLSIFTLYTEAQVGIGTTIPAASAQLDITSDSKGVLIPRMTSTVRTGIPSPAEGLLVYQTDSPSGFYYRSGSTWVRLVNSSEPALVPSLYAADKTGAVILATLDGNKIPLSTDQKISASFFSVDGINNDGFNVHFAGRYQISYKILLANPTALNSFVKINDSEYTPSKVTGTSTSTLYTTSFVADLNAGDIVSLALGGIGISGLNINESTFLSILKLE
jgi:hypothetical protein